MFFLPYLGCQGRVQKLRPYKDTVHSITSDNGKEFARHKLVSEKLEADSYFARPYRSGGFKAMIAVN